ncbi:MAG: hypothetical protein DI570_14540 [Phenylobacterium zucineum]|nr:MAG: hypothetical protein DI570_14540 [Phenylobacterium zucineum]
MVKVRYTGLGDAREAFEALRPFRAALIAMRSRCRPFHTDYLVLDALDKALTTAAFHFTRDPEFYSARPPS